MDNIIEYIRTYGQNTFDQKPFNEVDSLVICQLSYMNFQPFVPSLKEKKEAVSVQSCLQGIGIRNRMKNCSGQQPLQSGLAI